ncbi:MAG: transposase, partial [Pirellulaceae bacterium]
QGSPLIDLSKKPRPALIRVLERIAAWAEQRGVELCFIQPGKPMQNGFIERFNGSYRRVVLDLYVFRTPTEVREHTERWLQDYNEAIPHDALGDLTPVEYRRLHTPETSSYAWT